MQLAVIYTLLAVIATIVNIGFQDITVRIYAGPYAISLSVLVGTATGLVAKYLLDKRYIFQFTAKNKAHDVRTFVLYAAMGLMTTAIFWAFEASFELLFDEKSMRYLGGILGLAVGYLIKYRLDKKFVFV